MGRPAIRLLLAALGVVLLVVVASLLLCARRSSPSGAAGGRSGHAVGQTAVLPAPEVEEGRAAVVVAIPRDGRNASLENVPSSSSQLVIVLPDKP